MKVFWQNPTDQSPIVFERKADFAGLCVNHWRVAPGELPEQTLPEHEITVTLSGTLYGNRQSASGKTRFIRNSIGGLCLVPSGQAMQASWDKDFECVSMRVSPELLKQTALENHFSPSADLREIYQDTDLLIQQLGLALVAAEVTENGGRLYADSLKQTLLFHLLKNYAVNAGSTQNIRGGLSGYKWRRVEEFINENLENDLSLAEIAAVAELSPYHFIRVFRRNTGFTPQQYLMQKRIERAKQLLVESNLPIVEVGLQAGFKNQSHFTILFRRFTRLTPKTWRQSRAL